MPLILTFEDDAYDSNEFTSDPIHVADAASVTFSALCTEDATLQQEWMNTIEELDVVHTDWQALSADVLGTITAPVKASYVCFVVAAINSTPCELKCQAFYFLSSGKSLQNADSSGVELYDTSASQMKRLDSSNGSIVIEDGNPVNLKVGNNLVLNNLTVNGTQTTLNVSNIASKNNYLLSNKCYGSTGTQKDCGFVSIVGATGLQYSILGVTGPNYNLMIPYSGMTGINQNDVIEICNSTNNLNDGIYQVDGVTGYGTDHYTIGIKGSPDYTFLNNTLYDQGPTGYIQKKYCSVIRYNPTNQLYEATQTFANTSNCNFSSNFSSPSFGYMYANNDFNNFSLTIPSTYVEISGLSVAWVLMPNSTSDIQMVSDGRIQYIGSNTKIFMASGGFSVVGADENFQVALFKNGSNDMASGMTGAYLTGRANNFLQVPNYYVSMNQNDYLSVYVRRSNSSSSYNLRHAFISIVSIA